MNTTTRPASAHACGALLVLLATLVGSAQAQTPVPLKTRNIVLIVSDGLRWQEIFTGADPTLLDEAHGGIWDKEADLKKEFWRADPQERRQLLFPFLWGTVAKRGQIFGNQTKGSIARVTNGLAFSYPGYNEMTTGHPDPRINSNEYGPNPNISVFEWLNGQPGLHGRVAIHATWATFKDIFNVQRSKLPLVVGWDAPYSGQPTPPQQLLNRLYATTTVSTVEDVYDAFMQVPLLQSFAHTRPRALFVGYGETDNWAHRAATTWSCTARTASITSSRSCGTPCRHCRSTRTRRPSSSPPITVVAAASPNGRSTASRRKARRISGSP